MGYVEDGMECPVCAENIPSASQVCPVCAEPLEMEDPAPAPTSTPAAAPAPTSAPAAAPAPAPAAVQPPHSGHDELLSADEETWDLVKDSNNIADIEYYLENYPNGQYSIPANLKLRQLTR
jgi:hypothetical protein